MEGDAAVIEPPRRQDTPPRCRCILTPPDPVAAIMYDNGDEPGSHCRQPATPDSPFCPDCEARHPNEQRQGFRVTAVPLVDR